MRTRKLGLALDMDTIRATTAQLQCAPMATMGITRTDARLTVTTVQVGSPVVSLLAPARGSAVATVAAATDAAATVAALLGAGASLMAAQSDADRLAVAFAVATHVEVA